MKLKHVLHAVVAAAGLMVGAAHAGPYILAGTDADDHGSASTTANVDGWFFMQRALENLATSVTTGVKQVTILGSTSNAAAAATSAFNFSNLVAAGWTINTVATSNFATFFGAGGNLGTGILMMDSGPNVGGGVNGTTFVPYATTINNFLGAGGGLFAQANGFEWLSALVPTLVTSPQNTGGIGTGLALTAAGSAAFPSLTNSDLSAGPFHESFSNVGAIPVLATSTDSANLGAAVIIGGSSGTITNPGGNTVPEPASLALVALALAAIGVTRKKTQG